MAGRRQRAFTLVELLVVIAVISILLLLMLPAINAVREMGRRTQCSNNLRNVALAVIHHESVHGAFPSAVPLCDSLGRFHNSLGRETGVDCMGPNWACQILGQIEEVPRYNDVVDCIRTHWHASDDCPSQAGTVGRTTPAFMVCPSAPGIPKAHSSLITAYDRLAKGNYAACLGSEHYRTAIEGSRQIKHDRDDTLEVGIMSIVVIPDYDDLIAKTKAGKIRGEWKFAHQWGTKASKVKDGLTNTILISEVMSWDGHDGDSPDIRGVWTSASMGASTYTHKYGPNSPMPDRINGCDRTISSNNPLFCERVVASGEDSSLTWASARSAHPNGVLGAMGDHSVRFFSDDIHLPLWQSYASRSGSEL